MGSCLLKKKRKLIKLEKGPLIENNSERNTNSNIINNQPIFEIKENKKQKIIKKISLKKNDKIILNKNLPKPTKWIFNGNEPFYYLSISDKCNLNEEMIKLFKIGNYFESPRNTFYLSKNEKQEITRINGIKSNINRVYTNNNGGFSKEENEKLFTNVAEKYIKMISEENNKENINKLYDDYIMEARNIVYEDIEILNLNNNLKDSKKIFDIYYSSFPENKEIKYFMIILYYSAFIKHG